MVHAIGVVAGIALGSVVTYYLAKRRFERQKLNTARLLHQMRAGGD